ncbi:MAG: thymidine phosphorylase [Bacteroidota bacterium]
MRAVDIIEKKRDGLPLERAEIRYFIDGLIAGAIPDYQASALCMAIYFRDLNDEETVALTEAMAGSGLTLDLGSLTRTAVDKHSTGGVGDKTTLVLAPVLAAAGATVAKMSGRGLGHTGGTLDKLESIPGMRTNLTPDEFVAQVRKIGLAVAGQTEALVPADKKLYALRDVTGTVPSIPLIASSIMAKKLAAGAGVILIDVKYGSGALLPNPDDGRRLASLMRRIGRAMGRRVSTCLSSMEQPLGQAIGNALEVREALATLAGGGPPDLREISLALAGELLVRAGLAQDQNEGKARAAQALDSGAALDKLRAMVAAQGGSPLIIDDPELLPRAKARTKVLARTSGYLARIDTAGLGRVAMRLGAGRARQDELVDPSAGLIFTARLGDYVEIGTPIAEIHTNRLAEIEPAQRELGACLVWSETPVIPPPLFLVPPGAEV